MAWTYNLAAIANKAVSPAEGDRYGQRGGADRADIDRWRERLPVKARRASFAAPGSSFDNKAGVALAAAAVVLLAGAAGVATANCLRRGTGRAPSPSGEFQQESRAISRATCCSTSTTSCGERARHGAGGSGSSRQRYLDRLSVSPGAPADLRLEIAQGYRRLAGAGIANDSPSLG